ncbi:MAG: hypothetical protein AB7H97_17475 [Pseudobdellovibrionaceae bacterium]
MKPNYKILDGINIQWPWSELIVTGKKRVETRSYRLPERLYGVEIAIIETPGKQGLKEAGISKARIIGTVIFEKSYLYKNKEHWLTEERIHLVSSDDSLYGFQKNKEKWAWVVGRVKKLDKPVPPPPKRGIIFAKNCKVPSK